MATEKRLIDANAFKVFLEGVRQDYIEENTFSSDFAANVIETVQDNYLELAPTVDAVEVVRCKDCYHDEQCICVCCEDGEMIKCGLHHKHMDANGYCHEGRRC